MVNESQLPPEKVDDASCQIERGPSSQGIRSNTDRFCMGDVLDGQGRKFRPRARTVRHTVGFSPADNCYIVNPLCYDLDGCSAVVSLFNFLLLLGVHEHD